MASNMQHCVPHMALSLKHPWVCDCLLGPFCVNYSGICTNQQPFLLCHHHCHHIMIISFYLRPIGKQANDNKKTELYVFATALASTSADSVLFKTWKRISKLDSPQLQISWQFHNVQRTAHISKTFSGNIPPTLFFVTFSKLAKSDL